MHISPLYFGLSSSKSNFIGFFYNNKENCFSCAWWWIYDFNEMKDMDDEIDSPKRPRLFLAENPVLAINPITGRLGHPATI